MNLPRREFRGAQDAASAISTSAPRTSSCPYRYWTSTFMQRRHTTSCAGRAFGLGRAIFRGGCVEADRGNDL